MVGGWVGVLDEINATLSPAGAWLWADLGKMPYLMRIPCNTHIDMDMAIQVSKDMLGVRIPNQWNLITCD